MSLTCVRCTFVHSIEGDLEAGSAVLGSTLMTNRVVKISDDERGSKL